MTDDVPTPPPPGPGALVAAGCGLIMFVYGLITGTLLAAFGLVVMLCAFIYATVRDRRTRTRLADEYLRERGLRDTEADDQSQ